VIYHNNNHCVAKPVWVVRVVYKFIEL